MIILTMLTFAGLNLQSPSAGIEQRIADTLTHMTLDEKIDMLSGLNDFYERGVPRLGVPPLKMSDGPAGLRNDGPTTAYPAPVSVAASFNVDLARQFGIAIGRDARARGVNIWLGPGLNLSRVPQNGRNFEYFGEDPLLAGHTAANVVQGVQSQGVVATVKHFDANNYEDDRMVDSSDVDERTLRELYLKPFQDAVQYGGAWAVMCAYNKLNGTYASENPFLLDQVLRKDWGFHGVLMSDWGAVHSTLPALKAGLDLEMPNGEYVNRETVKPLIKGGEISVADINEKVRRILRLTYSMGFDKRPQLDSSIALDDPQDEQTALQIAREGTVLLKNRGNLLPLDNHRKLQILVVGPNAQPAVTGGGGSAYISPIEKVSLLDAIQKEAGPNVEVLYEPLVSNVTDKAFQFKNYSLPSGGGQGLHYEEFSNMNLEGSPVMTKDVPEVMIDMPEGAATTKTNFSARWTSVIKFDHPGQWTAIARSDDGIRVYLDDHLVINDWNDHGEKVDAAPVTVEAGRSYRLRVEYFQDTGDAIARVGFAPMPGPHDHEMPVAEIRHADAIIAAVGFSPRTEGEGTDRPFTLPYDQEYMLEKIVAINPRVIVVNNSGAGVDMSNWVDQAGAIMQAWYPGGIGNRAIAEILFGRTNPSGKLPTTFPRTLKGTYYETAYPSVNHHVAYKEGLFMGYRWFDQNDVAPLFPFGFGLSYTTFHLDKFKFEPDGKDAARLTVHIRNTGSRDGAETIQVYVHPEASPVARPVKELKAFAKVMLKAGEARDVAIRLELSDLAYYNVTGHKWVLPPGKYDLLVGTSSRDLPLKGFVKID
jgi:beta-glucosidase